MDPSPRRGYPRTATRRYEAMIVDRLHTGATYVAIALALASVGVTLHIVRYTARRRGLKRPAGRPRATAPTLIPTRSTPPARW